ncbi:MAG: radical SAM protein [Candidatus Omnitrophota bacterium]|jgi:MoaA/NifB/PqqE/SkfB family radical SAM enzyme
MKERFFNMPDNRNPEKRFTWNIHYSCNYRCPYCFFEGKWLEYQKRNVYLSPDEWMEYWNRIYDRYGRSYILITGGEPFIYPDFIELIGKLSAVHYPINISTNTSGDLKTFADKIDPAKVSVSASLQLNFENMESFLKKVKFLKERKFLGCINFVAYPPLLEQLDFILERFDSIGEKPKVIPFWGKYQDREYPFAYSDKEKEFLGVDESWMKKVRKKDSRCAAGYNSALIFPDGKVARCGQIGEKMLLGDFLNDFKLLDSPAACDAEYCPCDEGELFGEKEEKDNRIEVKTLERQRNPEPAESPEQGQRSNSGNNDNEYNSRKTDLSSTPKAIFIQAAGPCNSSCVFCSRGPSYEFFDLETHRKGFKKTLYPAISRCETLILTGSGEYLQLPGSEKILEFFDSEFPHVQKFFSTNGSSLVPWAREKLINGKSRYTVHVSMHASNAALHKVMTRMDNFDTIVDSVRQLVNKRKNNDKPQVNLIFVATTLNIDNLPDFVRMAADLKVDKVVCYYNFIYIPAQKYLSCFFKQGMTNKMLDEAETAARKLNVKIDLPPRFGLASYPKPGVCREPFSQIMFDSQGHALPCDAYEDCDEILSDNKSFMDIWNGPYYQKLRKSLIDGTSSCFKHCLRANPACVNDFKSHVIHRGNAKNGDINLLWGDNF